MEYDFNVLYYIGIYKKWWKKIALVMVVSISLTACISLFMPVTYVSTVSILSAVESEGGMAAGGALGSLLGLSGFSTGGSSNDIIISILNSRRMSSDVREKFELQKKPKFRYDIDTQKIAAGMAIDVKGNDPELTKEIANFVVQNLDKINTELDITPTKPMVKVLDPAIYGSPGSRQIMRKIIVAALLAFLLLSFYAFFSDYLRKLKSQ